MDLVQESNRLRKFGDPFGFLDGIGDNDTYLSILAIDDPFLVFVRRDFRTMDPAEAVALIDVFDKFVGVNRKVSIGPLNVSTIDMNNPGMMMVALSIKFCRLVGITGSRIAGARSDLFGFILQSWDDTKKQFSRATARALENSTSGLTSLRQSIALDINDYNLYLFTITGGGVDYACIVHKMFDQYLVYPLHRQYYPEDALRYSQIYSREGILYLLEEIVSKFALRPIINGRNAADAATTPFFIVTPDTVPGQPNDLQVYAAPLLSVAGDVQRVFTLKSTARDKSIQSVALSSESPGVVSVENLKPSTLPGNVLRIDSLSQLYAPSISADAGNRLVLGSDNLAYFRYPSSSLRPESGALIFTDETGAQFSFASGALRPPSIVSFRVGLEGYEFELSDGSVIPVMGTPPAYYALPGGGLLNSPLRPHLGENVVIDPAGCLAIDLGPSVGSDQRLYFAEPVCSWEYISGGFIRFHDEVGTANVVGPLPEYTDVFPIALDISASRVLTLTESDGTVFSADLTSLATRVSDGVTVAGDGHDSAPLELLVTPPFAVRDERLVADLRSMDLGNSLLLDVDGRLLVTEIDTAVSTEAGSGSLVFTDELGVDSELQLATPAPDVVDLRLVPGQGFACLMSDGSERVCFIDIGGFPAVRADAGIGISTEGLITVQFHASPKISLGTDGRLFIPSFSDAGDLSAGTDGKAFFREADTEIRVDGRNLIFRDEIGDERVVVEMQIIPSRPLGIVSDSVSRDLTVVTESGSVSVNIPASNAWSYNTDVILQNPLGLIHDPRIQIRSDGIYSNPISQADGNVVVVGSDGGLYANDRVTSLVYNPVVGGIEFVDDVGVLHAIDLDLTVFEDGNYFETVSFDSDELVCTLRDLTEIRIDLSQYKALDLDSTIAGDGYATPLELLVDPDPVNMLTIEAGTALMVRGVSGDAGNGLRLLGADIDRVEMVTSMTVDNGELVYSDETGTETRVSMQPSKYVTGGVYIEPTLRLNVSDGTLRDGTIPRIPVEVGDSLKFENDELSLAISADPGNGVGVAGSYLAAFANVSSDPGNVLEVDEFGQVFAEPAADHSYRIDSQTGAIGVLNKDAESGIVVCRGGSPVFQSGNTIQGDPLSAGEVFRVTIEGNPNTTPKYQLNTSGLDVGRRLYINRPYKISVIGGTMETVENRYEGLSQPSEYTMLHVVRPGHAIWFL